MYYISTDHQGISLVSKGKTSAYMSRPCDQQCFTISKVEAEWHELTTPQGIMWPSTNSFSEQLDPQCSLQTYLIPINNTSPLPCNLLLIFRPVEGRRLSWHTD